MRILLGVHQFFPHHYTGTERYVLNLAKQLQRMGHFVKVLTYSVIDQEGFTDGYASGILSKNYDHEGVPVISVMHKNKPDDHAFCFNLIDSDIYEETRNIFAKEAYDIYHCAHPFRITASIKAARDAGVKVLFMATDYWLMCPLGIMLRPDNVRCEGPEEGRMCLKHCFAHVTGATMLKRVADSHTLVESCDCLLSPSQFLITHFDRTGFIPSDRFILSRHGFDYTKKKSRHFEKMNGTITFGYIGTVQYHKGVHIMVEGFHKSAHKNARLQVWGGCFHEIEYMKDLRTVAQGDSRIEFKGSYNFNEVEAILRDIDVVIVPSIWYENAPLTITTSLAYGIPVITSDVGGMSEMIKDGKNGLTFKAGDPDDLSTKIDLIVYHPERIEAFRRNIQYPIRVEEEAFNTELIYGELLS
ncbi:MAG TPA: glycosyltransferase family 4 protein [Thermodesulfovibrionales bacterium]|nr:glycosyltransferase family 4 protein [Thermodesulfovibrionales bacterium]